MLGGGSFSRACYSRRPLVREREREIARLGWLARVELRPDIRGSCDFDSGFDHKALGGGAAGDFSIRRIY
eukprot:832376-Pyramimonas_sp.AAC.1